MNRRHVATVLLLALCTACQAPDPAAVQPPAAPASPVPETSGPATSGPAAGGPVTPAAVPGGWRYVHVGEGGELWDVAATAPDDVWAVGAKRGQALLLHYDGRAWRPAGPPGDLGEVERKEDLLLDTSRRGELWLFSPGRGTRVHHWDGTGWDELPAYSGRAMDARVFAPGDIWILADGRRAGHWDGTRWRTVTLPAPGAALAATAPDDMWAVGDRDVGPAGKELTQPVAMHWNGRAWRLVPTPAYRFPDPAPPEEAAYLGAVAVLPGGQAWAAGLHTFNGGEGGPDPADPPPVVMRWDGSAWTSVTVPTRMICCAMLAPDGAGGVLLATDPAGNGNTWHLTAGGAATRVPPARTARGQIGDIKAMTRIPGTRVVVAVGALRDRDGSRVAVAEFRAGGG